MNDQYALLRLHWKFYKWGFVMRKLIVRFQYDPLDTNPIYIAIGNGIGNRTWIPAYRDTHKGEKVLWVRTRTTTVHEVWVKDSHGVRRLDSSCIVNSL